MRQGLSSVAPNATEKDQLARTVPTARGMARRSASHVVALEKHDCAGWLVAFYKF